jgi:hypothetical protein
MKRRFREEQIIGIGRRLQGIRFPWQSGQNANLPNICSSCSSLCSCVPLLQHRTKPRAAAARPSPPAPAAKDERDGSGRVQRLVLPLSAP